MPLPMSIEVVLSILAMVIVKCSGIYNLRSLLSKRSLFTKSYADLRSIKQMKVLSYVPVLAFRSLLSYSYFNSFSVKATNLPKLSLDPYPGLKPSWSYGTAPLAPNRSGSSYYKTILSITLLVVFRTESILTSLIGHIASPFLASNTNLAFPK